ncbi:MAG: hypothetical protein WBO44_05120, partial [Saprospiraceae bacterium]
TLTLSNNDLRKLENNVDYKYPLLLNNRENAQQRADTVSYFSKNFNTSLEFSETDLSSSAHYNLVLFNKEHKVLGNAQTSELGSEETNDYFRPFDNGNGFIQYAYRYGYSMNFKIYSLNDGKYIEKKHLESEVFRLHSVCVAESGNSIALITYNQDKIYNIDKYSINGSKLFSIKLENIDILPSSLYISNNGKYISYYYKKIINNKQGESWYAILNENGKLILNIPVFHIGNFPALNITYKNIDYLIVEGHKVCIIDLTHTKLIREIGGENDSDKAYRVYIKNNRLYILFVEYKFINNKKVQYKKYIRIVDIETGRNTDTITIPYLGEISLYLQDNVFYLKLEDGETKNNIFKLQI